MEFECFDFENPKGIEKTEEEKHIERIQTSFVSIQQASVQENRLIKQEDLKKKKQRKALNKIERNQANAINKRSCLCYDSERRFGKNPKNQEGVEENNRNNEAWNGQNDYEEKEDDDEEDDEDDSQYLLEDEILLDLDFFNKKGDENIDKCIMEKVSIWNDVRPVIQVVAKMNRIEIIYDNGHRLLKDFKFLIKKLEQYKENKDAKLAQQLLEEHQKNIEHEEKMLERISMYYDHEMHVLFDMIAKNYQISKQMAYDIIDAQDQSSYFAFSIRKLNCEGGIQHISGPFGYSKPLIDVFGGDMETYIRFIMRKGVIEHFDRQSHFLIFLMKLRIVTKTDLNVVTLDNIKIPISVTLYRHSLSHLQIMPQCFKEDYLKIYKIEIRQEILSQLFEMRRSKEQFQNSIQGIEDFEYFMQSQIFYDKFYKRQRPFADSVRVCRYRYLDRIPSNRYLGKSQRKNCEDYLSHFKNSYKIQKNTKIFHKKYDLHDIANNNTQRSQKGVNKNIIQDEEGRQDNNSCNIEGSSYKNNSDNFHHDISIESQTIKQEESNYDIEPQEQIALEQKYKNHRNKTLDKEESLQSQNKHRKMFYSLRQEKRNNRFQNEKKSNLNRKLDDKYNHKNQNQLLM